MVDQGEPLIHGKKVGWGGRGFGGWELHPVPFHRRPLYHNFIFRIMRDQKHYVEKVIFMHNPPYPICALWLIQLVSVI